MKELLLFCVAASLLGLLACAGEGTLEEVDPEAAPANPTYSEHVSRIMEQRCTACHSEDSSVGEEHGVGYETCDKVKRNWHGIEETVFDGSSMPPGGADRVTSAEMLTLARWYQQGATCN